MSQTRQFYDAIAVLISAQAVNALAYSLEYGQYLLSHIQNDDFYNQHCAHHLDREWLILARDDESDRWNLIE